MSSEPSIGLTARLVDPYLPDSGWKYSDVVLALLSGIVGSALAALFMSSAGSGTVNASTFNLTYAGQAAGTLLAVSWLGTRRGTGEWFRDVGLRVRPVHWWGLFVGVALQVVVAVALGPLVRLLAPEAPRQAVVDIAERSEGAGSRLVMAALLVLVAPMVEEIVFRGVLLSRLRRTMGPMASILLSALAFAGIHLLDPNAIAAFPGLFVIGLALGWAALRTADLSLAFLMHAGVNLTGVLVVFFGPQILDAAESVFWLP